eukprot:TRINITY_DN51544_c0_g1_i1.p2 TRINITY_DN51544_c0_g1~~TRINITY_DN51544_c0_g1_i1.p2  ORF type:complete len:278 (-),score=-1.95 TRINITY_DN51544_c0_g1_i1:783-1616(-)
MGTDSVPHLNKHPGGTVQPAWVMQWLMNEITAHRQLMESAVKLLSTTIPNVDVSPQRSTTAEYGGNVTSSTTSIPPPWLANVQYHCETTGTRQCLKKCDNTTNRGRSSAKEEPPRGTTQGNKVHPRHVKPAPTTPSRSHSPDCKATPPPPVRAPLAPKSLDSPRQATLALDTNLTDSMSSLKPISDTPQNSADCTALADVPQVCGPPLQHGKGNADQPESKGTLCRTHRYLPRGPCHAVVQGHLLQHGTSTKQANSPPNPSALLGGNPAHSLTVKIP